MINLLIAQKSSSVLLTNVNISKKISPIQLILVHKQSHAVWLSWCTTNVRAYILTPYHLIIPKMVMYQFKQYNYSNIMHVHAVSTTWQEECHVWVQCIQNWEEKWNFHVYIQLLRHITWCDDSSWRGHHSGHHITGRYIACIQSNQSENKARDHRWL